MGRRRRFLDGAMRRARTPLLAAVIVAMAGAALAQPGGRAVIRRGRLLAGNASVPEDETSADNFLPADRALVRQWNQGRAWFEQGRYSDAIRCLQGVLEAPGADLFQPDSQTPTRCGLKFAAWRLIGQLPPEGRRLYELQCGHKARRLLDEAVAGGDAAKLDAAARYVHTQAGDEATFLLGLYHLDHGRPLTGQANLRRLRESGEDADRFEPALTLALAASRLEAGDPEEARRALVALKARRSTPGVVVGGREVEWFRDGAEAISWLAQLIGPRQTAPAAQEDRWLMFRGDAARNAAGVGSAPLLSLCSRIPTVGDGDGLPEAELLRQRQQQCRQEGKVVVSALHPLVVGDVVLMRNLRTLLAANLVTGKRLWEVPADDPLDAAELREPNEDMLWRQGNSPFQGLAQRLWQDGLYGTLSSDGRLVFSIEDLPLGGNSGGERASCNRLAAHDLRTGKLKWHVGGHSGAHALRQAETFFLGPPLPLEGRLYALAEVGDEVCLLVLDADDGNFCWSQQLPVAERNSSPDAMRRTVGLSPSYAGGVLICPAGPVVAVDLATHAVLWGFAGGSGAARNAFGAPRVMFGGVLNSAAFDGGRWLEPTATVAEGRVLATFPLDDAIYCLSLADGKLLWKTPLAQDDLYLACVHAGNVVLVRRGGLGAIRLADGKPAWTVPLPAGSEPSGRGFYAENRYFLPLQSAEAAVVDLDAGRIIQTSRSREGRVPGNLVYCKGRVISQGVDGLEVYFQADAVRAEIRRRLAVNPDDAHALTLQGQTLLDEGKLAAAATSFRRAWKLAGDERARQLLRETLLEGLRGDFAAYRSRTEEIERLLDDATQRALFLRLMAGGLQKAGESLPALEQFLRLADLEGGDGDLEEVDRSLLVRRDRWIRSWLGLASPRGGGESSRPDRSDRRLAIEDRPGGQIRRRLAAIRRMFRRAAGGGDRPPEADPAAGGRQALARGRDAVVAGPSIARGGRRRPRRGAVGPTSRRSGEPRRRGRLLPPTPRAVRQRRLPRGKTGKQLSRRRQPDAGPRCFATKLRGRSAKSRSRKSGGGPSSGCTTLMGVSPSAATATAARSSRRPRSASIRTSGSSRASTPTVLEQWSVQLAVDGNLLAYNPYMTNAYIQGHLIVVPFGQKVFALDPLGLAGGGEKVLWVHDLVDVGGDAAKVRAAGRIRANVVFGLSPFAYNQLPFGNNVVGAISSRYVCLHWMQNLVAVDPLNGKTLWVRRNVPLGSEVFGDEEFVFVAPPQSTRQDPFAKPAAAPGDAQIGAAHGSSRRRRAIARLPRRRRWPPSPTNPPTGRWPLSAARR